VLTLCLSIYLYQEGVATAAAALRANTDLVAAFAGLSHIFLTARECLVHGDMHTGSVMVQVCHYICIYMCVCVCIYMYAYM